VWMFESPTEIWKEPSYASHLEGNERVIAAIRAFSGWLGHPLLQSGPMWGSTLWEVALTDRRLLAVQRRLLPRPRRRKTISILLGEIHEISIHWDWGMQANIRIDTGSKVYEFKIWGFPRGCYAFTREMRSLRESFGAQQSA